MAAKPTQRCEASLSLLWAGYLVLLSFGSDFILKGVNWLIYTLKNPRTQEVRYVGWTSKSAEQRLRDHLADAVRLRRTHRQKWIFSLVSIGLHPLIEVIESGTGDGWPEAERRWIAFYRAEGAMLVNGTNGGEGIVGWGTPEEHQARAKRIGESYSQERRSTVAKQWRASQTPEQRRIHEANRRATMTPEKYSASGKNSNAPWTRAQRSASTAKWQASKTPEERSAAAVKGNQSRTPEQRNAAVKKAAASFKVGERSLRATQWQASRRPEERSASAHKAWETKRRLAKTQ